MKPAHIVTDRPDLYEATADEHAASFRGITIGPTVPADAKVKYVFHDLRPHADMTALAHGLRTANSQRIETPYGTIERAGVPPKHRTLPPTHLHFVDGRAMHRQVAAGTADGWELTAGWNIPEGPTVCVYGVTPKDAYKDIYAAVRMALQEGLPATVGTLDIRDINGDAMKYSTLPVLRQRQRLLKDTALLLTVYGNNEIRSRATRTALAQLGRLNPLPQVYFLELGSGSIGDYSDVAELIPGSVYQYRRLDARYGGIFQKEAAYNYMVRTMATSEKYLIFHDADAYPEHAEWAKQTRTMLQKNAAGQTWQRYQDTRDPSFYGYSSSAAKRLGWRGRGNPGLSWGVTRRLFNAVGGWNTRGICGSGDTLWFAEIRADISDLSYIMRWEYFMGHLRDLSTLVPSPGYVPESMVHCWHGDRVERGYNIRHEIIDHFAPIEKHIEEDADGFRRFKVAGCPFQHAIIRRHEAKGGDTLRSLLRAVGSTAPVEVKGWYATGTGDERE